MKLGNAGRGKDPDFWCAFEDGEVEVIGEEPANTIERQDPSTTVGLPPKPTSSNILASARPALRGYLCHILVDGNGIINVSHVPSDNSWRWPSYLQRRDRIDALRATAAAAVRHGVFRLDDRQRAADLAAHVRVVKEFDPALGLYAAYAYAEADQRDDIESVRRASGRGARARRHHGPDCPYPC